MDKTRGTHTADTLDSAANRLGEFLERVRGVAKRMRDNGIPKLDVTMEAAYDRATTDLKRWSRGVEDAMDSWVKQNGTVKKSPPKKRKPTA